MRSTDHGSRKCSRIANLCENCTNVRKFGDPCSLLCVPSSSLTAKQLSGAVVFETLDSNRTVLELLSAKVSWLKKKSFSLIICEIELQPKITAACIMTSKIYNETFKDHKPGFEGRRWPFFSFSLVRGRRFNLELSTSRPKMDSGRKWNRLIAILT